MDTAAFRLRGLSIPLRIAITCFVIIVGGGYAAAVQHMFAHYENKDERPGLSMDDITGSFHGVNRQAGLIIAINGSMRRHVSDAEHAALIAWLEGDRIGEDYDNFDLGDNAPAEILDRCCLNCHSRSAAEGEGIGERVPFDYWDDVKAHAFSRQLDPVSIDILAMSTHTHALGMAVIAFAASLLFLATGFRRAIRHWIVMLSFAALLCDLGSWWLARWSEPFCTMIIVAGGAFGALVALQLLGVFWDLWLGKRPVTVCGGGG